jgi:hypothetical protein
VETASLNRREVEDLVNVIAAEVVRQMRSTAPATAVDASKSGVSKGIGKEEVCEGCPRLPVPAAVSPTAVRLSADVRALAALMDHTLLRPEATRTQIEKVCEEALQMHFVAVCVNPAWVPLAAEKLRGSTVWRPMFVAWPRSVMLRG